jgi:hypothetical protein
MSFIKNCTRGSHPEHSSPDKRDELSSLFNANRGTAPFPYHYKCEGSCAWQGYSTLSKWNKDAVDDVRRAAGCCMKNIVLEHSAQALTHAATAYPSLHMPLSQGRWQCITSSLTQCSGMLLYSRVSPVACTTDEAHYAHRAVMPLSC